jgi:Bacterial membrane protein YfhO
MNKLYWQQLISKHRADLGAFLIIAIAFILFFAPVVFTGKIFVINDAFVYSYPLRSIAFDQVRHGSLPLWTSQLMSGYPLLSMSQLGIAYPLTWIYLFLPGYVAEELYVFAPFLLGPIFMYCWIRTIGLSRLASLFAALAFAYGGMMASPIAHSGILTNTMMWLPLILIQVEKARTTGFARGVFWATICYALSVLAGSGQAIVMVTTVVLGYGLFCAMFGGFSGLMTSDANLGWLSWSRWRVFAAAVLAVGLGSGISAFQILESMQAQELSIRSTLPYEIFSEGSFSVLLALKSLVAPLYYQTDVSTYMLLLALLLAGWAVIAGVIAAVSGGARDARIIFWLLVAVWSWIWMLGLNTPLYPLLYQVPLLNKFRVPSRHTFEWTFAVATLSAYGWDAIASRIKQSRGGGVKLAGGLKFALGLSLLAAAVAVAWFWWQSTLKVTVSVDSDPRLLVRFLGWKLLFTCLVLLAIWLATRITSSSHRIVVLVAAMVIACLVEPATAASYWWWPKLKTPARFRADSIATSVLKTKNTNNDRVYSYSSIWAEEYLMSPRIDPPNFSALRGFRDVGGYEPLFYDRYSRALGNVTIDGVFPRAGNVFDWTKFDAKSNVLDLLNTHFVVSYSGLSTLPDGLVDREGLKFFRADSYFTIKPGQRQTLSRSATQADALGLVSALAQGTDERQGTTVAKVRFITVDGAVIERPLRAGIDTAEWAIESPNAINLVQHTKAPVFDTYPVDGGKYTGYRFWSTTKLDSQAKLNRIEIENVSGQSDLLVWKASLYDSRSRRSIPLPNYDENKWRPIHDANDVLVIENTRALPRAWLVAEARVSSAAESLRLIRGDDEQPFDPSRTALLEMAPENLPSLPGGMISPSAQARIVNENPGHIDIETRAETPSVLIVSEVNFPGWKAAIDGNASAVTTADYLLIGLPVPAGDHRVELRYGASAGRQGAVIAACALCVTLGVGIYSSKKKRVKRQK